MTKKEINWGGRPLSIETGKIARQADGAVVVQYGGTTVLCTAVAQKEAVSGANFFPLTVIYQEKTFSVGRIPGGFLKREGKPSEKEVLTSRLIDRPIRPLFPEDFYNEVQVICTVLTYDMENDPDVVALIGASAALSIAGFPFMGPVAAARVGYENGSYTLNPNIKWDSNPTLDLVVAGTSSGVLMVESQAQELSEEIMLGAVNFGHKAYQPVVQMIEDFKKECQKEQFYKAKTSEAVKEKESFISKLYAMCGNELKEAHHILGKQARYDAVKEIKARVLENLKAELSEGQEIDMHALSHGLKAVEASLLRGNILTNAKRIDGRGLKDIRQIKAEVGVLPRTHGSALFTRGETQALVVTTLGTASDEQFMDVLSGEYRERFMLHYNFPPFSVGEVGRMSGPGRREIGHGKLAWRALKPMLPNKDQFSYTIRTVSEITESNGSSSMATVCGTSLSLMDAGVPLASPVAGIAMGLIKEGDKFAVLSDILGDEDHLGDMDFKVAGTKNGVTALQMDIKITSITPEIMDVALQQAREGINHILGEMSQGIDTSRDQISQHAPQMTSIKINKDKIRDLIGPGGKMIREICETTGAKIDIEEDGTVYVSAVDSQALQNALDRVRAVACDPEIGAIYKGTVVKLMDFGAFVRFYGEKEGLVHVSEMDYKRVEKPGDIVTVGQEIDVKVVGVDDRGKVKLSMKIKPVEK